MYYDWYVNIYFCYCVDDIVSDWVVMNDIVEDVNQNGFYFVVREDDFECFGYMFFGCVVVNVKEVSWFVVVQFNDVYCIYCQICVVNYIIDVIVQCNVVQFLLCSLCFMWIFL